MKANNIQRSFRKSRKLISGLIIILITVGFIHSCKNDDDDEPPAPSADESLFSEATATGFTYYQGGSILPPDSASPPGFFKLRLNSIAQAALDTTGELPSGSTFPEGSILVKEVFTGGGNLDPR